MSEFTARVLAALKADGARMTLNRETYEVTFEGQTEVVTPEDWDLIVGQIFKGDCLEVE